MAEAARSAMKAVKTPLATSEVDELTILVERADRVLKERKRTGARVDEELEGQEGNC